MCMCGKVLFYCQPNSFCGKRRFPLTSPRRACPSSLFLLRPWRYTCWYLLYFGPYSSLRPYSVTLYIQYIHTYIHIYIRTYIHFCCIFISPSMSAFHRCNINSDIAARVRGAAAVSIPERTHFSFSIPRNLRGSHEFRFCTQCNTYWRNSKSTVTHAYVNMLHWLHPLITITPVAYITMWRSGFLYPYDEALLLYLSFTWLTNVLYTY